MEKANSVSPGRADVVNKGRRIGRGDRGRVWVEGVETTTGRHNVPKTHEILPSAEKVLGGGVIITATQGNLTSRDVGTVVGMLTEPAQNAALDQLFHIGEISMADSQIRHLIMD